MSSRRTACSLSHARRRRVPGKTCRQRPRAPSSSCRRGGPTPSGASAEGPARVKQQCHNHNDGEDAMDEQLDKAALEYHRYPRPGKIAVMPTKAMTNQRDLSLAYSPGVAAACLAIEKRPLAAYDYTSKGNLVA